MPTQSPFHRDWIVESEDELAIADDEALAVIVSRLPAKPLLSVSDVAAALDLSRDVVYSWIDAGGFKIFSAGGHDKAFYRIFRGSFIEFLKSRIQ